MFTLLVWSITSHVVIAYLGYKHASKEAKSKFFPLLKSSRTLLGEIRCYIKKSVENPNSFWLPAISLWPDSINTVLLDNGVKQVKTLKTHSTIRNIIGKNILKLMERI